jgi:hypothetical protein
MEKVIVAKSVELESMVAEFEAVYSECDTPSFLKGLE